MRMRASMSSAEEHALDRRLGSRLRELRVALGTSQMALAEGCGITFQQIQKYESGANRMSVSRLVTMARTIGISAAALIEEIETGHGSQPMGDHAGDRLALELGALLRRLPHEQRQILVHLARSLARTQADVAVREEAA